MFDHMVVLYNIKHYDFLVEKYPQNLPHNSVVHYGFDCDMLDQNTKFGTVTP